MELFDTHSHLNDDAYEGKVEEIIKRSKINNVKYMVDIGYNEESSRKSIDISEKHEGVYTSIGVHPDECGENVSLKFIEELAKKSSKVVAIGEIGLDYYHDTLNKQLQKDFFVKQIKIANELGLPVIIHSRDADMDMLEILKQNKINKSFVMHCFSSSVEIAKEILKLGGYIAMGGVVTFKNAKNLLEIAKMVPDDKLLIETDCPYLSPEPFRGRKNEPMYIIYTAQKISELRGVSLNDLASMTTQNAKRFYNIIIGGTYDK